MIVPTWTYLYQSVLCIYRSTYFTLYKQKLDFETLRICSEDCWPPQLILMLLNYYIMLLRRY